MNAEILSIIAIVISIGVPFFEYISTKKINNINLSVQYYDEIYKDYLLFKIPEARMKVQLVENGKVLGADDFCILLKEIRKKSLYFKFSNEDFYEELVHWLQKLEDMLIMLDDDINQDDFNAFIREMETVIYELYNCIVSASHGQGIFD